MTLPVSIAGRAEADLTHQYRWYPDHAGASVAEGFLMAFDGTVKRISAQPELGKRRRFLAQELSGMRSIAVGRPFAVHLVFYRAGAGVLSIERVMHGAQNLPRRLLESPD
jgi:toxin ParE1/3/4